MQILAYEHPSGCPGCCLLHPHVFGRQLAMMFFEVAGNPGASVTEAAAAIAAECLWLIPGRDPGEVLWLECYPPEAHRRPPGATAQPFAIALVTYEWRRLDAADGGRRPTDLRRRPAPPEITTAVRRLWYGHDGPLIAARIADPLWLSGAPHRSPPWTPGGNIPGTSGG